MRRLPAMLIVAALGSLIAAPAAFGHAYASETGDGSDCLNPDPATACPTITQALAVTDGYVFAFPGTYTENVQVGEGSVQALGVGAVIQPLAAGPTVTTGGIPSAPGVIQGFDIKGTEPVLVTGPSQVQDNVFDSTTVPDGNPHVLVQPGATNVRVERNQFVDDGIGGQAAIETSSTGTPLVASNVITGFWHGIEALAGTPRLERNTVQGTHDDGGTEGASIFIKGSAASVTGNLIRSPGAGPPTGVRVDGTGGATSSATLARNQVLGHDPGVDAEDASTPLNLDSDLIAGGDNGLVADSTPVNATNLTAFDGAVREISLVDSALTLGSSIVEHPIDADVTSNCSIAFSAGPTSGSGCDAFQQSSASAGFDDPGSGDYGIGAGSPLVDAGDPSAPPAGATDIEGEPRAIAATCVGSPRRDIGADEFAPECPVAPQPDPTPPGGETNPAPPIPRDTDPPLTKIEKAKVDGRNVVIRFGADEPASGYLCQLDGKRTKPCASPKRYKGLQKGRHAFRVWAVDLAGNVEAEPARKRFKVR